MSLTKHDLLKAWTPKIEQVDVPELGDGAHVFVRQFSAADRGKLETMGVQFKEGKQYDKVPRVRFLTVALSLCDEQGSRLFTDAEIDEIGKMPASVVDRIFERAAELNALSKKAVEDAEKN